MRCATCSRCSTSNGSRSSGTRSEAASRCSSHTSSPSAASGICLVSTGGVAHEVHTAASFRVRAERRPGASVDRQPRVAHPRKADAQCASSAQHQPRSRRKPLDARLRRASRRGRAKGFRPHAARRGRLARPSDHHARPLLPHPGNADALGVGRARRDDPRLPRAQGSWRDARQPARGVPERRALPAQGRGGSFLSRFFGSSTTVPRRIPISAEDWRAVLRRGATVAPAAERRPQALSPRRSV